MSVNSWICRWMIPLLLSVGLVWAADFYVKNTKVSFELPSVWTAHFREVRLPSGQWMQRWGRSSVMLYSGQPAVPGMVIVATPVPENANLALMTQSILAGQPYEKKLAQETQCIKCMQYTLRMPQGTATTIAPDRVSACPHLI